MKYKISGLAIATLLYVQSASAVVGGTALDSQHAETLSAVVKLTINKIPCTGTLIGPGKILTASHCLIFADLVDKQPDICVADNTGKDLGCLGATDYLASMPMAVRIQPVEFNGKMYLIHDPDFALIEIFPASPVLSNVINLDIAKVASDNDLSQQKANMMIVGQGCTDYTTLGGIGEMRYGSVDLIDLADGLHFRATYSPNLPETGACKGDSGGPLLRISAGGDAIMYGVTSQEGFQMGKNSPILSEFGSIFSDTVAHWLPKAPRVARR